MRGRDSPCWPKGAWPLGQLANRFSSVPFHLTVSHTLLSKWVFVQVLLSYRSVCEDVYAGAVYANCLRHFGTGPACSKFSKATFIHRITSLFYLTNCTINFLFSFKLFNTLLSTPPPTTTKKTSIIPYFSFPASYGHELFKFISLVANFVPTLMYSLTFVLLPVLSFFECLYFTFTAWHGFRDTLWETYHCMQETLGPFGFFLNFFALRYTRNRVITNPKKLLLMQRTVHVKHKSWNSFS